MNTQNTNNKKLFVAGTVPITIGTDPEFMMFNIETGSIVSAIPVLNKGKEDKIYLTQDKNFAVYYDNTMMEMNVPPARSSDEMVGNIQKLFFLTKKHIGAKYDILAQASHNFTVQECSNEIASLFGCSEELCAWTFQSKSPPEGAANNVFRSAGGHIHIGREDFKDFEEGQDGVFLMDFASKADLIRVMDCTVGLAVAFLDNDPSSAARKSLYGEAGRHRLPIYGVEYRTPGNFWLSSPSLVRLISDITEYAAQICEAGQTQSLLNLFAKKPGSTLPDPENYSELIKAVNTNDKAFAAKYLPKVLPQELFNRVLALKNIQPTPVSVAWALSQYKEEKGTAKISIKTVKQRSNTKFTVKYN